LDYLNRLIARKGLQMPPEIEFLASPSGGAIVVISSLLLLRITLLWALRQHNPDRIAALLGGTGTAVLVTVVTFLAMIMGWWQGDFFEIPLIVILAIEVPLQIAGYTLWLSWYRWLRRKTARAPFIYGIIVLLFFPIVLLVDPIQMQRGQFFMGGGYTILADALLGQVVMWSPIVFYELARRRIVYDQKALAGP
jgi:F0F1-type ATP synthase assembly protein I